MKTVLIDWNDDSLNLYTYEKQGGRYILTDTSSVPMEDDLRDVDLSSLSLAGIDTVYLSLPLSILSLREQEFPFSDSDKIRDTINYELEGVLLGSINDYIVDHIVTESLDSGSKVLAVCLEKSKLMEIIEQFTSTDLEPKVITSIDLRLTGGDIDKLFDAPVSDTTLRAQAAAEELLHPSINLRQEEHAYTGDMERLKKTIKSTAVLLLVFLVILGGVSYLRYMVAQKENASLTTELQTTYKRVFPEDKKIVDAERQFKGNLNTLTKKKSVLSGIPLLDILKNVSAHTNEKVTLSEYNSDGNNLILRGVASSFEDVEALKNNLSTSFNNVKVTDSKATADNKIDFTIIMKEKTV